MALYHRTWSAGPGLQLPWSGMYTFGGPLYPVGQTRADQGRPSFFVYAGITPDAAGLYQVNVIVPAQAPDGDLPLTIEYGGVISPAGASLRVQSRP